jgi:hypothetical protein
MQGRLSLIVGDLLGSKPRASFFSSDAYYIRIGNYSEAICCCGGQFSIELELTREQRDQILPIIKQQLPKLEALKKNISFKPLDKIAQLKQIADEIDSKTTPLLNADQQKKFQQIRKEHRRQMVEKMGSELLQKAGNAVNGIFE